jgi:hypothetical protein
MSSLACVTALLNITRVMTENYDNEVNERIKRQQLYEDWQSGIVRNAADATLEKNEYKKNIFEKYISGFYVLSPWWYSTARTLSFSENPYAFIGEPETGPVSFVTTGINPDPNLATGTGYASTNYIGLTDTLPDPNISSSGNLGEALAQSGINISPDNMWYYFVAYNGKLYFKNSDKAVNTSILPINNLANKATVYETGGGGQWCTWHNHEWDRADHKMCSLGKHKWCFPPGIRGGDCGAWDWSGERNNVVANPFHWTEQLNVNIFKPYMDSLIERKNKNIDAKYAKINAENEARYNAVRILPAPKPLPTIGCCQDIDIDNLKANNINLTLNQTCNTPSPQSVLLKPLQNFRFI